MKYMQLWEEKAYIREAGYEEGIAEGDEKRLIKIVSKNLLKGNHWNK